MPELDFRVVVAGALEDVIGKGSMVTSRSGRPGNTDRVQYMMLAFFL